MVDENTPDWIENYGFILLAFAHMTDWHLAESEVQVINEKLQLMLSQSDRDFKEDDIDKKIVNIINRYESLKEGSANDMMDHLIKTCDHLKEESWFDKLSATVLVQFLAEIAEADHKIEKTEIQLLNNLADIFDVKAPRL